MRDIERNLREKYAFEKGFLQFRTYDKYARNALINNQIIFGAARNFNDPFDCNLQLDFNLTMEEIIKTIRCSQRGCKFGEVEIKMQAHEYQNRNEKWKEKMSFLIYEFRRFSCFNINGNDEVHSNSLFWANYANHHKGICLKFNGKLMHANGNFEENVNPLPIKYCSKIPEFNYLRYRIMKDLDSDEKAKNLYGVGPAEYLLGIKSEHWKYENEVRFVYKSENNQPIMDDYLLKKFNPKMLEKIYIGCNADQSTVKDILKIAHMPKYEHVEVIKLIRDKTEFKFNEERIK